MNTQNLVSNLHSNFPVGIASSNEDFQFICTINDVPPNAELMKMTWKRDDFINQLNVDKNNLTKKNFDYLVEFLWSSYSQLFVIKD